MILFALAILISAYLILKNIIINKQENKDDLSINTLMIVSWVLMASLFAVTFFGLILPKEDSIKAEKLYAFSDTYILEGNFKMRQGRVEEKNIIKYIVDTKYGKRKIEIENNRRVEIVEVEDNNIRVETVTKEFKEPWMWLIGANIKSPRFVFYVPEGTVRYDYERE